MIDSHILKIKCSACDHVNHVQYKGQSIPLKIDCMYCGVAINIYNAKDTIEQTRVAVGKIIKED